MNSLYKSYAKNALILFLAAAFFSVFFCMFYFYINNRDFNQLSDKIYMLDIVCIYILVFILYKDRNKKTGIFIQFLPFKTTSLYIFKTVVLIAFISATAFMQAALAYVFNIYDIADNCYTANELLVIMLCEASILTLSVNLIGVAGLAFIAPFAAFVCSVFATAGIIRFIDILAPEILTYWQALDLLWEFFNYITFSYNLNSLIFYSMLLIFISGIINNYIDYSSIGRLFFFKGLYIPFLILATLISGFALFFVIIDFYGMYVSAAAAVILLLISIVICGRIFKKIYSYYE